MTQCGPVLWLPAAVVAGVPQVYIRHIHMLYELVLQRRVVCLDIVASSGTLSLVSGWMGDPSWSMDDWVLKGVPSDTLLATRYLTSSCDDMFHSLRTMRV